MSCHQTARYILERWQSGRRIRRERIRTAGEPAL